jgi:lysozyme
MHKLVDTIEMNKGHEGLRLKPYKCTSRKLTIGYGRNLDDKGITEKEADTMLLNDIIECIQQLTRHFPWIDELSHNRQAVLIKGLMKFEKTLDAIRFFDYDKAADYMLQSEWAKQVGQRAITLSNMMREG